MRNKKPNFRVKHPYQNLINSIFMGLVLLLSSILSVFLIKPDRISNVQGATYYTSSWSTVKSRMASSSNTVRLSGNITIPASELTGATLRWYGKLYGNGYELRIGASGTTGLNIVLYSGALIYNVKFNIYWGVTSTSNDNAFFERVSSGATIQNCEIHYDSINSYPCIRSNQGTIKNCRVTGTAFPQFKSSYNDWGGICYTNSGTITQCINEANVSSGYRKETKDVYTGGLVGTNSGTVSQCINDGNISGMSGVSDYKRGGHAAGIVGYSTGGTISDCYNLGNITGGSARAASADNYGDAGGSAAGICVYASSTTVRNCFNLGTITGGPGGTGGNCTTVSSGGSGGSAGSAEWGWPHWNKRWGRAGRGGYGGYGGYGGGQGGSAGATLIFATSSTSKSGLYGFTDVKSGRGGTGGVGAGGGGGGGGGGSSRG